MGSHTPSWRIYLHVWRMDAVTQGAHYGWRQSARHRAPRNNILTLTVRKNILTLTAPTSQHCTHLPPRRCHNTAPTYLPACVTTLCPPTSPPTSQHCAHLPPRLCHNTVPTCLPADVTFMCPNQGTVLFSSIQFKMVSMRSEKSIKLCAPPRLSEVSPTLPLKRFQCPSDWRWPSSFQGRSSSASSFVERFLFQRLGNDRSTKY